MAVPIKSTWFSYPSILSSLIHYNTQLPFLLERAPQRLLKFFYLTVRRFIDLLEGRTYLELRKRFITDILVNCIKNKVLSPPATLFTLMIASNLKSIHF